MASQHLTQRMVPETIRSLSRAARQRFKDAEVPRRSDGLLASIYPLCGSRMSPEELLDSVADRESFLAFLRALAVEREEAEVMERAEPVRYQLGGAMNWQNGDISSFLWAALHYFEPGPYHQPECEPSWKMLAEFLYFGKIYE